jgi:hypothetical protein
MVAHSQFCLSGDNTLEAANAAIKNILEGSSEDQQCQRFVFVLSDANFERYGITASEIKKILVGQFHYLFILTNL